MPFQKGDASSLADDLRQLALFAKVGNADLVRIAELGEPTDAEAGAVLIDQGDVGLECFLVIEGEAGIFTSGQHAATIGPGTIVGEMALLGHRPRNASVVAQTPMRLLSFDIERFKRLLDEMPVARQHVFELLEARTAERAG